MLHRLHPLMALLSTIAMFFLFTTSGFSQMACLCPNSIDFDLNMGSNVPIQMDCLIDIDITPSDDPAIAGEWFVDDLMVIPSTDDPSCASSTIVSIQITRVLMISPTFQVLPFTGNMVTGLTAGDELTIDFEVQLSNGECSEQQYSLDIVDNDPPVIDCPVDVFVDCVSDIPNVPVVTFMDNCLVGLQNATYEGQTVTPDQCAGGSITRTWTAIDMFGFVDTCRQNIIISADVTPPTGATLPNLGPFCMLSDAPTLGSVFDIQNTSGIDIMDCTPDNALGYAILPDVLIAGTPTSCPRTYMRSYTLTDDCGNVQTYSQEILVDDPTGPTITTQPQPVVDFCTDNTATNIGFAAWVAAGGNAVIQEDCPGGITTTAFLNGVDITSNPNSFLTQPCPDGAYVVTFQYTNGCGVTTTSNPTTYTIDDNTTPDITVGSTATFIDCNDPMLTVEQALQNWVSTGANSTAIDACSAITLTSSLDGGATNASFTDILNALNASIALGVCQDNFPLEDGSPFTLDNAIGSVEVTYTYTDACGNPTTPVTVRFTVTDNDPPTINQIGGNLSISCSQGIPNITPEQSLINWLTGAAGGLASDGCSNATFNATVVTGGVATGTTVLTNSMISFGGASILDILTDGCGITGEVTVLFQATDDCGNLSSTTYPATFSLTDNDPPVILTQPEPIVVNCNDDEAAILAAWTATRGDNPNTPQPGATAMDNCGTTTSYFFLSSIMYNPATDPDGNPSTDPGFNDITLADLSNGCGPTGMLSMTVYFVDECGNTSQTGPVTFTVLDDTPPTVTQMAMDASAVCDGTGASDIAFQNWLNNAGGATAFDNCGTTTFTFLPTVPVFNAACGATGSYTVEFFAQDECGISTSAGTATFTLEDNNPPTVTSFPEEYVVECGPGNANELNLWAVTRGNNPDTPQPGFEAMDGCSGMNVNTFYFPQGTYDPATDMDNNPSNDPGFNTADINDLMGDVCSMAGNSLTLDFFASD